MTKKEIRKYIKELKQQMSAQEIEERSAVLCDKFLKLREYKESDVILCYISYNQEVRTDAIIRQAWADGKRVAAAKVVDKERMEFVYIDSFDDLERGVLGIPEPKCSLLEAGPDRIANEKRMLVLMPGLAFDNKLNRVGYGGGYYDRYFASHPDTEFIKAALCYDFQLLDEVPHTDLDMKTDILITDK